ncbi:helix-turn-helix domain-containing protein [Streptomyces sp. NPDC058440]|uniref:helix-turn-helix domain-containing protein n=1 Tax=Streptomyces sp. NPDC058440 TaxID=3346501 RepID=UPI00365EE248
MRVQRTKWSRSFVQIPNEIARNGRLSLEARGLLVFLLSLPDHSRVTVEGLCERLPNGRRAVSKAMNELIEAGYVKRAKLQDPETGRWVTITTVTDAPDSAVSPSDRLPTVGEPTGQVVGGSPIGSKTVEEKNTTPPLPEQAQEAAVQPSEGSKGGGEGETAFLTKIDREMAREARRILGRLSCHKSLPLTDRDIARLAPKVVPWLREAFTSNEILRCLTHQLPTEISSVPGLISHRLTTFTPERSAPQAPMTPSQPIKRTYCEVCEATFPLGHQGGICRNCMDEMDRATALHGVGAL